MSLEIGALLGAPIALLVAARWTSWLSTLALVSKVASVLLVLVFLGALSGVIDLSFNLELVWSLVERIGLLDMLPI